MADGSHIFLGERLVEILRTGAGYGGFIIRNLLVSVKFGDF